MKNSKMKKITGALLAAVLLVGVGSVFIAKTTSSFKFVAEQESKITSADFSAKVYKVDSSGAQVGEVLTLDSNTVGGAVTLPIDLNATDLLFKGDESKEITLAVQNTGNVDQSVVFNTSLNPNNSSKLNDIALAERTSLSISDGEFGIDGTAVTVEAGTTKYFQVKVEVRVSEDQPGMQGADNAAIGGQVKGNVTLSIQP